MAGEDEEGQDAVEGARALADRRKDEEEEAAVWLVGLRSRGSLAAAAEQGYRVRSPALRLNSPCCRSSSQPRDQTCSTASWNPRGSCCDTWAGTQSSVLSRCQVRLHFAAGTVCMCQPTWSARKVLRQRASSAAARRCPLGWKVCRDDAR